MRTHYNLAFWLLTATSLVLFGCEDAGLTSVDPGRSSATSAGQLAGAGARADQQAAGRYIVVLRDGIRDVPDIARQMSSAHGAELGFVYQHALQGFSVSNLSSTAAQALQRNPQVAYVSPDEVRSISAQTVPTGIQRIFALDNTNIDIDGTDDFRVDVDVAVIDTGVDFQHPDLNVVDGVNCAGGGPFGGGCKTGGDDDHYHGTHVAGTIAALDNGIGVVGVAPGARIYAVKVLDKNGSGWTSWIVAGIDWVAANASTIEVANMSLGGSGYNQAEYDAIQGAVTKGVAFAVAAGNSNANAGNYSPAAFDNVLTVSALADFNGLPGGGASPTCRNDQDDTLADFSNWGDAVDIAAPGVCILSTYPLERGEYGTISGTSMASPHAAGALSLLASKNNPANATDVQNLYDQVMGAGNSNWTDDSGDGTKEPLLDVSNTTVFNPKLIAGGGDDTGGGGDDTGGGGDGDGGTGSGDFPLSISAYKVRGFQYADLSWSGATSTHVDVVQNESVIATTANDGAYTDARDQKGGGSATYKICEAGTSTCSNEATATW